VSRESQADLVAHLQRIGFTQYEARIYITLARTGPLNGNEISQVSGVPSSKTYETLRKLLTKGAVTAFPDAAATRYVAHPPTQILERYREDVNHTLDQLEVELGRLGAFEAEEQVFSMRGELSVLARARELLQAARTEIYLSLWSEELPALRRALLDARDRDLLLHVMLYGQAPDLDIHHLYHHSHADIVRRRIGGRLLVLVTDGSETLVARFAAGNQIYGFSSRNQALALLAQEYLGHDIILECAKDRIERAEWDAWWQSRADLIEVIVGRERALYGEQWEDASSSRSQRAP
jgi:sugar-specific transcriptional regulator TrmB